MNLLNLKLIQQLIVKSLNKDLFRGHFGLENEKCKSRS